MCFAQYSVKGKPEKRPTLCYIYIWFIPRLFQDYAPDETSPPSLPSFLPLPPYFGVTIRTRPRITYTHPGPPNT